MISEEVIQYVIKRTQFKARQIVRQFPTLGTFEDIQNHLREDVLRRLPRYNGDRAGVKTFIGQIIDHRIANLIKSHHAKCRDPRRNECSLDDWVRDETGAWVQREATVNEDRARAHRGPAGRSDFGRQELALDIASVLATLSPELRDLGVKLQTQTPAEIARETGIPRSILYKRIAALRVFFTKAQLHHYL